MPKPTNPDKQSYLFSDDMKFLQKAVIFHPNEYKILALKRSMNEHSRPGKWDLVGGNVSYGENHEQALRREIKEESNLEVDSLIPLHVYSQLTEGIYHLFIGYKTKAINEEVIISHEHTEFRWVTPEEFMALDSAEFLINLVKQACA